MRLSLQTKYSLVILTVILAIVAVLTALFQHDLRASMRKTTRINAAAMSSVLKDQLRKRGEIWVGMLAENLINPLYRLDLESMEGLLAAAMRNEDVAYIYVYDPQGAILHDGREGIPLFGITLQDDVSRKAVRATSLLIQEHGKTLDFAMPVRLGDQSLGGVRIGFSLSRIETQIASINRHLKTQEKAHSRRTLAAVGIATSVLTLLGLLLSMTVTRRLTRPIKQLARLAQRIGRGEKVVPPPALRNDELGDLAAALGDMYRDLRSTTVSRDYLDRIVENMNEALIVTDAEGVIRLANRAAGRMLDHTAEELIGHPLEQFSAFEAGGRDSDVASEHISRYRTRSGREVIAAHSRTVVVSEEGIESVIYVAQDITERKRQEEKLKLSANVFERAAEGILIMDHRGVILSANPAFINGTGFSSDELIGKPIQVLGSEIQNEEFYGRMMEKLAKEGCWEGEIWSRRKDGTIFPEWLTISAIEDEKGKVTHYAGIFLDLSEIQMAQKRIFELAFYDYLTGLPNRALFKDRLEQAITRSLRDGHLVALLYLDLDRFKIVNDTHGHATGDLLLKKVSGRLQRCIRDADTLARLGGDEFAVILPDLDRESAPARIAEKIVTALTAPFHVNGIELHSGSSIGISLFPSDTDDIDMLLQYADTAMYRAKQLGGNQFRFYATELDTVARKRFPERASLRRAVAENRLRLFFQPQWDMVTRQVAAVEALVHWPHPGEGWLPLPTSLVEEECPDLVKTIGKWILHHAGIGCRALRESTDVQIPIVVHTPGIFFRQPMFTDYVATLLGKNDIGSGQIYLAVDITTLLAHTETSLKIMERLRLCGVHFSVDDVKAAGPSLSALKKFPIHRLKLAERIVRQLPAADHARNTTEAVVAAARTLGLGVIAAGVTNPEQMAYLKSIGCDFVQGDLLCPSLPEERLSAFLNSGPVLPIDIRAT